MYYNYHPEFHNIPSYRTSNLRVAKLYPNIGSIVGIMVIVIFNLHRYGRFNHYYNMTIVDPHPNYNGW